MLFTNPEMLHASFLGWHDQWQAFLKGLRVLVLDEGHEYHGYFGSNVALLLRRFLAKLELLGVRPQLVLASATCANPEEHAQRLTGRRCTVVRAPSGIQPERHFAFINPAIPDYRFHDIFVLRIARAALACVSLGLNTLIFCPSRKFAEEAAKRARKDAPKYELDPDKLVPYRSAYTPEQRRDVEEGFRDGRFQAVFSTNTLEIGIDIGRLDVCILAGFPDNVASAWQRIGRVGRNWEKRAYVLFYASNNPFDQFYVRHIDMFLNKPLDHLQPATDNEELMKRHLPFFVHECGGQLERVRDILGQPFSEYARQETAGTNPAKRQRPYYNSLSLRGTGGKVYRLVYRGKEIGEISEVHLFREAYVGAVYNHFGNTYRVKSHGEHEVELEDCEPHLRTKPLLWTIAQSNEAVDGFRYGEDIEVFHGKLVVYDNFSGYELIDSNAERVLETARTELARRLGVRGFWLSFVEGSPLINEMDRDGLFAVEQLLRFGTPFVVSCDRHDLSTFTLSGKSEIYLYETVPGDIRITEKVLKVWRTVLKAGMQILEACSCKRGCPNCVVPHRLPLSFEPPRKDLALQVGRRLLEVARHSRRYRFDPSVRGWIPEEEPPVTSRQRAVNA